MSLGGLEGLLSYVNAHQSESRAHGDFHHVAPVVTLAADHGAGGPETAAELGRRLGVQCFDKHLLDNVIKEAKSDPGLMRRLDEELPPRPGTALYAAFLGINDPLEEYRRLMIRVLNGIALRGGVILGRGAHLLVRSEPLLRVRLIGSVDVCAWRLAGGDASKVEAMRAEAAAINADKVAFMRKCYNVDRDDPSRYDLVINTDRFADMKALPGLIVSTLEATAKHSSRDPHRSASSVAA